MTDRDSLIELIRQAKKKTREANCDLQREMIIADYLLANGVIVPPCKVGDIVYIITVKRPCHSCYFCTDFCHKDCTFEDKTKLIVKKAKVCSIELEEINKIHIEVEKEETITAYCYTCWFNDIGKTVFLTKEEAEEKLKELNDNA